MAIEHASVQVVHKPWGVSDLQPWSNIDGSGDAVGELWFQRPDQDAPVSALLLKLLFTSEPLSIQVHPDDAFARSIGLPNGKTEAWYILSASPAAQVAVGLKRHLSPEELRASIKDGSIADLVQWRPVVKGDVLFVPAGTIHAIGAGIVLAEIQQRSDTTFRLFDYGRQRELHEDKAVAVSDAGPVRFNPLHGVFPPSERFSPPVRISCLSGSICRRIQAGRSMPIGRRGFWCSMATRRSDWPRHRSARRSSSVTIMPASRSDPMGSVA